MPNADRPLLKETGQIKSVEEGNLTAWIRTIMIN